MGGGGAKRYVCPPNIFIGGATAPPAPPGSTPLVVSATFQSGLHTGLPQGTKNIHVQAKWALICLAFSVQILERASKTLLRASETMAFDGFLLI